VHYHVSGVLTSLVCQFEDKLDVDIFLATGRGHPAGALEVPDVLNVHAPQQAGRDDGTVPSEEAREGLGRLEPELIHRIKHAKRSPLACLLKHSDVLQKVGPERIDAVEGRVALPDTDDRCRLEGIHRLGGELAADEGIYCDAPFGFVH